VPVHCQQQQQQQQPRSRSSNAARPLLVSPAEAFLRACCAMDARWMLV
jgi:hypothetical protein